MGGGARGDIGWVGHGHGALGAYLARRRALRQTKTAVEADLAERGLPIPPRPMSRRKIFCLGLLCALLLGLFVGLIFLGINLT
jgi:hypothetical protein